MAIINANKLVFYHPCDSLTDADSVVWTNGLLWGGDVQFVTGKVGNAIQPADGTGDMGIAGYGDYTGAARITTALWGKDLANSGGVCNIGFAGGVYQIVQIYGPNVAMWIGGGQDNEWRNIMAAAPGWHFYVLDLERSGGNWILRHSIDGAAWTTESPKAGNAMSGSPTQTHIAVTSGGWADEIAAWMDADLFTSEELQDLYNLGSSGGAGLDQYDNKTVNIASDPSAAAITVSPNDSGGNGSGTTPFSRNYESGTDVTLTAPATSGNRAFAGWRNSGGDTLSMSRSFVLTVSGDATITAHYESIGDSRDDHSVASP